MIGDVSHPLNAAVTEPAHDEVARRAYELYEQRGGEHGFDWDDWLQAERELREHARRDARTTESAYAPA